MSARDLPRAVRAALGRALPHDWRDDILRDLEEAWTARRAATGPVRARIWLWAQALAFAVRFAPARLGEATEGLAASADFKLALRSVGRAPVLALLAVASLSVGMGAAVTGYTAIRGSLFTGLPFDGGERIYLVQDYNRTGRYSVDIRAEEFLRRRDRLESFEYLAAFTSPDLVVGRPPEATVERTVLASPDLLHMTGVAPLLGRLPDDGDVRAGAEPVIVLPHVAWVRLLGSDPDVLGRRIAIGGVERTIIGVMPEGFGFPFAQDLWVPVDVAAHDGLLRMVGKLDEGADVRAARAELAAVAQPDPTQIPEGQEVAHLVTKLTRPVTDDLQLLWVAVPIVILVLLLLVMATNVANLVLARNATRASELAVRAALGGSRSRIVGQLVLEVVTMVAVAAVFGVGLSRWALTTLSEEIGAELPFWTDLSLDPSAVLFAIVLAGLVTLVAGVAPARRTTAHGPAHALRDGAHGTSAVRFGRIAGILIVVQVAVCVGFLSAATLLGQSLLSFGFQEYGLPTEETLIAQLHLRYPDELTDPTSGLSDRERAGSRRAFLAETGRKQEEIRAAVLDLPGVRFAAYGSRFPGNESERERIEVEELDRPVESTEVAYVGPGYMRLLDAEVVQGRALTADELAQAETVVLVNEPFVRERLAGGNAVGRRLRTVDPARADGPGPWATIVGVVPDLGLNPGNPSNAAAVYRPLGAASTVRLAVRGEGRPAVWAPGLIEIARRVDPDIQVQWTRTLAAQMREPVMIFRILGLGFLFMGAVALLLSSASIHALTACAVSRRARELGIRQALGAGSTAVVRSVLRRSMAQLAVGASLGAVLAAALLAVASRFPWEVRQANPTALAVMVGVLALSGTLALAQPMARVLAIRPADAMRSE